MKLKFLLILFLAGFLIFKSVVVLAGVETVSNIDIDPNLDVSWFSSYHITADISGSPTAVSAEVLGINQDGGSYWNYYANGSAYPPSTTHTMTDADLNGSWTTGIVRPDHIYPQIFFAPSSITWNNVPSSTEIRRANYHLLHFNNSFTSEASSTFFIEVNAVPRSLINSADLEVYLVNKNKAVSFFNSDWRASSNVELVGTIGRNTAFNHNHVVGNSSHYLVALNANADGTFGQKNLDISGDFWIILYNTAPNSNRGWDLKYHSLSLCSNGGMWYTGNQSNWATVAQSGCPDVHVHFARRGTPSDGVSATITATYNDGSLATSTGSFYFDPLPNLAPNQTSFLTPIAGATYDSNEITISWDPAADPNNDDLTYNIYYYNGLATTTIVSATSATNVVWDTSAVVDGAYGLKGEVCDNAAPPLCTAFYLSSNINLERVVPIYSLTNINVSSNNSSSTYAKVGDTISLTFTASGDISPSLNVNFYSGGEIINGLIDSSSLANVWTVTYVVDSSDTEGTVDYLIYADNLDFEYTSSVNITVDKTDPETIVANPVAGNYSVAQNVALSSVGSDQIRYTIDGSIPSCTVGTQYSSALSVTSPITIKAIACDAAGNTSAVSNFLYDFIYTLSYVAGFGGTISGDAAQLVGYNSTGSAITAVANSGYVFSQWSDGSTANPRADTNVLNNLAVTAIFSAINTAGGGFVPPSMPKVVLPPTFLNNSLNFSVDNVYQMAISDNLDFVGVSWEPYNESYKMTEKTLYVKFRSQAGGVSEVYTVNVKKTDKFLFTRDLKLGMVGNDVRELQKYLNNNGYKLTNAGAGAPNNETNYFGRLTRQALIVFQKVNQIYPAVGYFGPITKGLINSR